MKIGDSYNNSDLDQQEIQSICCFEFLRPSSYFTLVKMTLIPPYGRQTLTFDPSPNLQISRQNIIIGGI